MLLDHWPLLGLRLITPRLELRLPAGEELGDLADLAAEGMHDPAAGRSWSRPGLPPRTGLARWCSATGGTAVTGPLATGPLTWLSSLMDRSWASRISRPVTIRSSEVSTFSWLGVRHHGKGIGTQMRAAALHLAFTALGATDAISGAFDDTFLAAGLGETRLPARRHRAASRARSGHHNPPPAPDTRPVGGDRTGARYYHRTDTVPAAVRAPGRWPARKTSLRSS